MKMSDVFDLPLSVSQAWNGPRVKGIYLKSYFTGGTEERAEAACEAINQHDQLVARVEELEAQDTMVDNTAAQYESLANLNR